MVSIDISTDSGVGFLPLIRKQGRKFLHQNVGYFAARSPSTVDTTSTTSGEKCRRSCCSRHQDDISSFTGTLSGALHRFDLASASRNVDDAVCATRPKKISSNHQNNVATTSTSLFLSGAIKLVGHTKKVLLGCLHRDSS
jgi:hypothetical protein